MAVSARLLQMINFKGPSQLPLCIWDQCDTVSAPRWRFDGDGALRYLKRSDRAPIGLIGSGLLEGVLNLKGDVEISSLRTDPFSKELAPELRGHDIS